MHRAQDLSQHFRDDSVNVARHGEPRESISVAAGFGVAESCLSNWMRAADVPDCARPGKSLSEDAEVREAE